MTVRTPLYWNGSELQIAPQSAIDAVIQQAVVGIGTLVELEVVASDGDSKFEMTDTRYKAGESTSNIGSYLSEEDTPDIEVVEITTSTITETVGAASVPTADTSLTAFPVYLNASNEIQVMSKQDFLDTFISPALDSFTAGGSSAGTYFVSTLTSGITGAARVSTQPIFVDTRADASKYTQDGVPEELDQPITITQYYLWKWNNPSSVYGTTNWKDFMYVDSTGALKIFSETEITTLVTEFIQYAAKNTTGYRLSYSINGAGTTQGTGMTDTILDGTSAEGYLEGPSAPGGEYVTQEVPTGDPIINNTYYLKLTTY